jgi:hypothetical protein
MGGYIILALGACSVVLLAGWMGAMPSPRLPSSLTDNTWFPDQGTDRANAQPTPVSNTRPQLPAEILDALTEGRRLGKVVPGRLNASYDGGRSVPDEFEDKPMT